MVNKRLENRRANLRALIGQHGGPKAFSELMGYKTPSFLVQMAGPNPSRPVTEDTARAVEAKLGLQDGAMDSPSGSPMRPLQSLPQSGAPAVAIVQMLAAVWEEDKVDMPILKFAQIAGFAITEAAESDVLPTPGKLRRLIDLLK